MIVGNPQHGCLPDDRAHPNPLIGQRIAAQKPARRLVGSSTTPRGAADLSRSRLPRRFDQGQFGSCTEHAISGWLQAICQIAGKPLPKPPSMRFLWSAARGLERTPDPVTGLVPDFTNVGNMSVSAMIALGLQGLVWMLEDETSDGRYSDIENATWELPVDLEQLGARSLVTGEYTLDVGAGDVDIQMALLLDQEIPIYLATMVGPLYDNWSGSTPLDIGDASGGGHGMYVDKYWTVPTTSSNPNGLAFSAIGSYGEAFANKGIWDVTGGWCRRQAFDAYAGAIKGITYA